MTTQKTLKQLATTLAASAALFSAPSLAFDLTGKGFVQYGDAQSYSLPVLGLQAGCDKPGCEFYVNSTPGAIKGLTVLGTGAGGTDLLTNFMGMDNAYSTPNGTPNGPSNPYWAPSTATYNGTQGALNYNGDNTWDSSLLALKNYLAGEAMIFFFNNNQINSCGQACQSLAAWAQITVRDNNNQIVGIYDLTNRGTTAGLGGSYLTVAEGGGGVLSTNGGNVANYTSTGAGPVAGNAASTDYVLSGGALCLLGTDLVNCNTPGAIGPINHNLGANQAAYALLFPELNAQLTTLFNDPTKAGLLGLYTMSVDVRLGCDPVLSPASVECLGGLYGRNLNNGYEQIFISKATDVVNMPEPATMALLGLALIALGAARRRA